MLQVCAKMMGVKNMIPQLYDFSKDLNYFYRQCHKMNVLYNTNFENGCTGGSVPEFQSYEKKSG